MSRKLKKKILRAKNKRNQLIFQHAEQHADEHQKNLDEEEQRLRKQRQDPDNSVDDVVWSAKMQKIRNKLTGRKRMAKERWNRFAGTSGGGARGL